MALTTKLGAVSAIVLHGESARGRVDALESNQFARYGGCYYGTGKTSVEEKTPDEIRSGARGSRLDVFDGWGGISSGCADGRRSAVADRWSRPPGYAW